MPVVLLHITKPKQRICLQFVSFQDRVTLVWWSKFLERWLRWLSSSFVAVDLLYVRWFLFFVFRLIGPVMEFTENNRRSKIIHQRFTTFATHRWSFPLYKSFRNSLSFPGVYMSLKLGKRYMWRNESIAISGKSDWLFPRWCNGWAKRSPSATRKLMLAEIIRLFAQLLSFVNIQQWTHFSREAAHFLRQPCNLWLFLRHQDDKTR